MEEDMKEKFKKVKRFMKILYLALADISMCDARDYSEDPLEYVEGH